MSVVAQGSVETELAGQEVVLLPNKTLYWPAASTLFVADLHLGKGSAFRARGVPVPTGASQDTLKRLSQALEESQAKRLCILGDMWHARDAQAQGVQDQLVEWRRRHLSVEVVVVPGNHDEGCSFPASFEIAPEGSRFGPFQLLHHPRPEGEGYGLAGHLHPGARLVGRGDQSIVLPCFWFQDRCAVLPAFGTFTGFGRIRPQSDDRVFVVTWQEVLKV